MPKRVSTYIFVQSKRRVLLGRIVTAVVRPLIRTAARLEMRVVQLVIGWSREILSCRSYLGVSLHVAVGHVGARGSVMSRQLV